MRRRKNRPISLSELLAAALDGNDVVTAASVILADPRSVRLQKPTVAKLFEVAMGRLELSENGKMALQAIGEIFLAEEAPA